MIGPLTNKQQRALELRGPKSHDTYHHDSLTFTDTTRTVLAGALAQRVRRRLGLPSGAVVWLKERYWEGGTDYTRECASEFVVGSGDHTRTFIPENSIQHDGWAPASRDSVYARFDHWLEAAHSDARSWSLWIGAADLSDRDFVKIDLPLDAALGAAAQENARQRLHSAYLWGIRLSTGWAWELHTISAQGFSRPQYGDIFRPRLTTLRMPEPTRTPSSTNADRRRILMWATDTLMPANNRF